VETGVAPENEIRQSVDEYILAMAVYRIGVSRRDGIDYFAADPV